MTREIDVGTEILHLVTTYGLQVAGSVAMLVAGWIAARWAARATRRGVAHSGRVDPTLLPLIEKSVRGAIVVVTVIAVLNNFGVETTSIIAVLGAAGLAVGLAIQGALTNLAAGLMMAVLRPFTVGDLILAGGVEGQVAELGIFTTLVVQRTGEHVYVPNNQVFQREVVNYSRAGHRRLTLNFSIGYGDDMARARVLIAEVTAEQPLALSTPAAEVGVALLADSSVNLELRVWVKPLDDWNAQIQITEAVKRRLDQEGISIPFPQRDVHVYPTS